MITHLRNGRGTDGSAIDVVTVDGRIAEVLPSGTVPTVDVRDATVHDLHGYLLLPAPAEPHAHLDKAYTADVVPNPAGDLLGAIEAWSAHRATLTVDDIARRAEAAVRTSVAHGFTAIRTHVDIGPDIGLRGIEALCEVRERTRHLVDLEIVILAAGAIFGWSAREQMRTVRDALAIGADTVGGAPFLDDGPVDAIRRLVDLAVEHGARVDLHTDETLDSGVLTLREYARLVGDAGLQGRAVASHCVSLGMQPESVQREVAAQCAANDVSIVTLPHTNLFLQARDQRTATPRGLTAIAALREAGVNVAGGGDNLQDPFNTVGRADPLETAALLVMAGHLGADDAYHLVSNGARRALGIEPVTLAPGSPAELLAIDAPGTRGAIAAAPAGRLVFHRGRLVSQTRSETTFAGA